MDKYYYKRQMRHQHDAGNHEGVLDTVIEYRKMPTLFRDADIKVWINEAFEGLLKQGNPYYLYSIMQRTDRYQAKPWTVIDERHVADAIAMQISEDKDHYLFETLKMLRATWKDNQKFLDVAAPVVADALRTVFQEYLAKEERNKDSKWVSLGDNFEHSAKILMVFPELLEQAQEPLSLYVEKQFSKLPSQEDVMNISDKELEKMAGFANGIANLFSKADLTPGKKTPAPVPQQSASEMRAELLQDVLKPAFLTAVENYPALRERISAHCVSAPASFPLTARFFADQPAPPAA